MIKDKFFYIVDSDVALSSVRLYEGGFHCLDLPNGQVLLSCHFPTETEKDRFEQHASAEPLPEISDPTPIKTAHVDKLKHLGIKAGHTTRDVRKAARAIVGVI